MTAREERGEGERSKFLMSGAFVSFLDLQDNEFHSSAAVCVGLYIAPRPKMETVGGGCIEMRTVGGGRRGVGAALVQSLNILAIIPLLLF